MEEEPVLQGVGRSARGAFLRLLVSAHEEEKDGRVQMEARVRIRALLDELVDDLEATQGIYARQAKDEPPLLERHVRCFIRRDILAPLIEDAKLPVQECDGADVVALCDEVLHLWRRGLVALLGHLGLGRGLCKGHHGSRSPPNGHRCRFEEVRFRLFPRAASMASPSWGAGDYLRAGEHGADEGSFHLRPDINVTSGEGDFPPRLLPRDYPFHQSSGKLNLCVTMPTVAAKLMQYDIYHLVTSAPTRLVVLLVILVYCVTVLFFTLLYALCDWTDVTCQLGVDGPVTFQAAFAFAVETQTTVGYGMPAQSSAYFEGCPTLPLVVFFHSLIFWLMNAVLIGGTLARLARANLRAINMVFSNKACINTARSELTFQVCELSYWRSHPAVEAKIRVYAALWNGEAFHFRTLALAHPPDDRLFMPVPCIVTHIIDDDSPLQPPPLNGEPGRGPGAGGRSEAHLRDRLRHVEIIVLVEAIDPQTNATYQARHSYTHVDIVFNHDFQACVRVDGGRPCFDMRRFHETEACTACADVR